MDRGNVFTFLTVVLTFWLVQQSLQQDSFEQNTKLGENKHPGNSKAVVATAVGSVLGFVLVLSGMIIYKLIKRCRRRKLPCFKYRWRNNNSSRPSSGKALVDSDNQSTKDDTVEVVITSDKL